MSAQKTLGVLSECTTAQTIAKVPDYKDKVKSNRDQLQVSYVDLNT